MKTSIKILLLILFSIGAMAGVLVFAKTIIAPPIIIKQVDQYSIAIEKACEELNVSVKYNDSRNAYVKIDDKLNRFRQEDVINDDVVDTYRQSINENYGQKVVSYTYDIFQKTSWPETQLKEAIATLTELENARLSNGESTITSELKLRVRDVKDIEKKYQDALKLSQNTAFISLSDAERKISKAREYKNTDYLKNNTALVKALNDLPAKIATSHYNYVKRQVDNIPSNYNLSNAEWEVKLPVWTKMIDDYKNAKIYNSKPDISKVDAQAKEYVRGYYKQ